MAEVFVISDTHFGHGNILKFKRHDPDYDGEASEDTREWLRPFKTLTEMHVEMIDRWNSVVTDKDKVYHLGDVAMSKQGLRVLHLMNGKKRLVKGNHDLYKGALYAEYFDEIYGVRQINGIWLTHVPMHTQSVYSERVKINVHGHLHANRVMTPLDEFDECVVDPKYFNACVECINYTPISIDEIPIP